VTVAVSAGRIAAAEMLAKPFAIDNLLSKVEALASWRHPLSRRYLPRAQNEPLGLTRAQGDPVELDRSMTSRE